MKPRTLLLLPVFFAAAGCGTRVYTDAQTVFAHAFGRDSAPAVTAP